MGEQTGEEPALGRSASVREPTSKSPTAAPVQKTPAKAEDAQANARGSTRDAKRRTVQVEYVAPKDATGRSEATTTTAAAAPAPLQASAGKTKARDTSGPVEVTPSGKRQSEVTRKEVPTTQAMLPPIRPGRDQQRSASDMLMSSSGSRPGTSDTLGRRMPSRGNSYSQPAMPAPTNTNAQAQLSQPQASVGYVSSTSAQGEQTTNSSRPVSQQNLVQLQQQAQMQQRGHKRSSTLGSIGDRILGRSSSRRSSQQQQGSETVTNEKKIRKYPPVSMKNAIPNNQHEIQPRPSTESTRRTSFGFSRKSSNVPSEEKRSSRRFSFLPSGLSMSNFTGRKDSSTYEPQQSQQSYSRDGIPPSKGVAFGQGASRTTSESTNSTIPLYYDSNREASRDQRRTGAPQQQSSMYEKALPQPPSLLNPGDQTPTQKRFSDQPIPQPYNSTTQTYSPPPTKNYSNNATPVQSYSSPAAVPAQASSYPSPPPIQRKQYRDDGYGNNLLDHSQAQTQAQDPVERFYTPTSELPPTQSPVSQQYSYTGAARTQQYQPQYPGDYTNAYDVDDTDDLNQASEPQRQQQFRPNQRNFAEQYERGNSGSSSATRRVMDFFRRRGKEREV